MFFKWEELETKEPLHGVKMRVFTGENIQMVLFELEPGAEIPTHSHPHEQMGTVLEGKILLKVGEEERILSAGEGYRAPADVPHSGKALEKTTVLDVFSPPREEYR